jgi:hypothetical protein
MPKEQVKDCVKRAAPTADPAVLRRFADLAGELGFADPLGFEGTGIATLRQYPASRAVNPPRSRPPLLVTSGPGVKKAQICRIPHSLAYEEDRDALFISYLYDERQEQGEGITSFFVRKYVYLAFFGWPTRLPAIGSDSLGRSPSVSPALDDKTQPAGSPTTQSPRAGEPATKRWVHDMVQKWGWRKLGLFRWAQCGTKGLVK